jgi:dolichyl-phosphate-mannose-protein mannosyltransferase
VVSIAESPLAPDEESIDRPPPPSPTPSAADRLRGPRAEGGWRGWAGPAAVTAFAGVLRFWHLGQPHAVIFDETYYAKDAYSLLHYGYESQSVSDANTQILAGHLSHVWTGQPSFVVHPPLGKWTIAVGIKLFGMTPFGWRFMVAVLGTLAVLVLARTARRMTGSNVLGTAAGFLLAIDGLALTLSRTAILDGILMAYLLFGVSALVVDRDRTRARLARDLLPDDGSVGAGGLGGRPFLWLAGVCFGMALATKWSALAFMVVFGALVVWWSAGARRVAGSRHWLRAATIRDLPQTVVALLVVPVVVYVTSWTGWLRTSGGYDRTWASDHPAATGWGWVPAALRSLWHYHYEAYQFHIHLDTPHSYASSPFGWLLLVRPVSFFWQGPKDGQQGCTVASCAREVLALGTPLLWWSAVVALVVMAWLAITRLDWRAAMILAGVAAGWLPWFRYLHRTIFQFYAVVTVPFLILAVVMTLGMVLGRTDAPDTRRAIGAGAFGSYLMVVFANFWLLWPIFTAQVLPYQSWWWRLLHIRSWV